MKLELQKKNEVQRGSLIYVTVSVSLGKTGLRFIDRMEHAEPFVPESVYTDLDRLLRHVRKPGNVCASRDDMRRFIGDGAWDDHSLVMATPAAVFVLDCTPGDEYADMRVYAYQRIHH